MEVETIERASHGECRAPLPRARFGSDGLEPLLLCIVCLGNGRIELVRTRRVVSFELIVYLGGGIERFFKEISPDER